MEFGFNVESVLKAVAKQIDGNVIIIDAADIKQKRAYQNE